ncbi:MAG: Zn-dependent hydrolase [Bacteroidales bacterium]|nr:Zn-dependent hydrolase [Bacteroidales bacterium]
MKKLILTVLAMSLLISCKDQKSPIQEKVDEYAIFEVSSPLMDKLSDKDKQVLNLFRQAGNIIDGLFWEQTFGDKSLMENLTDPAERTFAKINYGPWDRLDDNLAFVEGYGPKPLGANYYPEDITVEEFAEFNDPDKNSLYTVIRRDADGALKSVWYHEEYNEEIEKICLYLEEAAAITDNEGLRNYLHKRIKAFRTDDYFESDMAWMDMKDSKIDIVIGPIENYDDKLNEAKASYECFILLKDEERSAELAKYVSMLPQLQKMLPCAPEYKTFVPGTSSDLNVYDAIYYSGDCNAGSKTIAINLPNDDRVQALKGTRRLQLHNSMMAKFGKILLPIGRALIEPDQQKHLRSEAFFWNVTFHEVAHGLGVKQTVNGLGSVDEAMGSEKTTWEEAKADILGLFMVCELIDMGEIPLITKEDAITTYIAGLVRSVRFGSASSHGKANMMCYNFMKDNGAFSRNKAGLYHIDYEKALEAIDAWADLILTTQATGNYMFAKEYTTNHANITEALSADIAHVNDLGIPRDITFEFVW